MPGRIHLTVAAVIQRDNRFLCVRELERGRFVINQPAGHVEPGESLVEAVLREALEETGWSIQATALLGLAIYTAAATETSCNPVTYYRVNFACELIEHDPGASLDPDIAAVLWLSHDEMRQRESEMRSPLVLKAVEDFLSGRRYPLGIVADYR